MALGPVGKIVAGHSSAFEREENRGAENRFIDALPAWFRNLQKSEQTAGSYDFGDVGAFDSIGNRPMFPPQRPAYTRPKVPSDIFNGPYKGPDELDNYSGETPFMRIMFRRLYCSVPELGAAIDSKVDAIAAEGLNIQPEDRSRKIDREMAELAKWSIENSEDGSSGLIRDAAIGMFIDGWSVVEPTFGGDWHPKLRACTSLEYARGLDTAYLRLELDSFRRNMGLVSLRRGLETFDPSQVLIFTHRKWFANPFGNSDVRSIYTTCLTIEDAFRLWDFALKYFGMPYVKAKAANKNHRKEMENAIKTLRSLNYIVTGEKDEVELLNLVSATGYDQFRQNIETKQRRIYQRIRGASLPFLEGEGGGERRGDTEVHKNASDITVDMPAKYIAHVMRKGLIRKLRDFNFPDAGVPLVTIGATDVEGRKTTVAFLKDAQAIGVNISAKFAHEELGVPPPEDDNDILRPMPAQGDAAAPGGGTAAASPTASPGGTSGPASHTGAPTPGSGPAKPEGSQSPTIPPLAKTTLPDGDRSTVASVPPAPKYIDQQGSVVPPFSINEAGRFADFFTPDAKGRYPGELHAQFGADPRVFAYLTGLRRQQVFPKGKDASPRWFWVPANKPAVGIGDGTVDVPKSAVTPSDGVLTPSGTTPDEAASEQPVDVAEMVRQLVSEYPVQ